MPRVANINSTLKMNLFADFASISIYAATAPDSAYPTYIPSASCRRHGLAERSFLPAPD